jgi:hypothetical protein
MPSATVTPLAAICTPPCRISPQSGPALHWGGSVTTRESASALPSTPMPTQKSATRPVSRRPRTLWHSESGDSSQRRGHFDRARD